jgi:hypothetical protein
MRTVFDGSAAVLKAAAPKITTIERKANVRVIISDSYIAVMP